MLNLHRLTLTVKVKSFEFSAMNINHGTIIIVTIYRRSSQTTKAAFLNELDGMLSILVSDYSRIVLCGDVNLQFEFYLQQRIS